MQTRRLMVSRACRYYASDAELRRLFKSVNGLIFPGGLVLLLLRLHHAADQLSLGT